MPVSVPMPDRMTVIAEIGPSTSTLGARVGKDAVTFTVWAPRHESVTLAP